MKDNTPPRTSSKLERVVDELLNAESRQAQLQVWDASGIAIEDYPRTARSSEALADVANSLRLAGRYADCSAVAERALALAYDLRDENRIAEVQAVLGAVYMNVGDMRQAGLAFLDVLAATRRNRDNVGICRSLLWLAYVEQAAGHLSMAIEHTSECLDVARKHDLTTWSAAARRALGSLYTLTGRFRSAIDSLSEAEEADPSGLAPIEIARTLLSLSFARTLSEEFNQAENDLASARRLLHHQTSVRDLAISYEYEAALRLNQGKLDLAEEAIKECLRISLEEFPDGDMTSQGYRIWAEIDVRRTDFNKAREHASDALGVARRVGERIEIGAIERILGQCDSADGRLEDACAHFTESIKILSDCGARYEMALSYLAAGQADCHDRALRLSHLHTALALFREMEVERFAAQTEDVIRSLTSIPPPKASEVAEEVRIITRSKSLRDVLTGIDRVKEYDDIILLEGETGVGKDLLAKYAHFTSHRAGRPFILFNAAAVPETLAESELFGHVRGSFSGALRDREGLLFSAKDGTFFFNEITEAPPAFQAKLLSVIETRSARPIGANLEKPIGARLIFATNRRLDEEVRKGTFRKDLFFRLSTAHLLIPPLRERPRDIEPLLVSFLERQGLTSTQISELRQAHEWKTLHELPWEGNVRELQMFARRITLEIRHAAACAPADALRRVVASTLSLGAVSEDAAERMRIATALRRHGGNKRRAAAELGMPESTLRFKMQQLGLHYGR